MEKKKGRVVGLDVHPDSFAGAVVEATDPAGARVLSSSTRVELERLEQWALRHTREEDTLVLEASGNAFSVAMRLRAIGRKAEVLDSHRAGKVGKVYCANDRVDAVKIARIYLSALSPIVWQPDEKTLERREIFSAYQAVVKESTRAKQQLRSMLNEHCVRLEKGFRLCHPNALTRLLALREWTPARRMLLQQLHDTLVGARTRRTLLRRHMAQEIVAEEALLRLTRLCGINLITLYGVAAAVGDVRRFPHSKKLVAYLGLNPSVSQSGNFEGSGATSKLRPCAWSCLRTWTSCSRWRCRARARSSSSPGTRTTAKASRLPWTKRSSFRQSALASSPSVFTRLFCSSNFCGHTT